MDTNKEFYLVITWTFPEHADFVEDASFPGDPSLCEVNSIKAHDDVLLWMQHLSKPCGGRIDSIEICSSEEEAKGIAAKTNDTFASNGSLFQGSWADNCPQT